MSDVGVSCLKRKGKYIFELDADEENKQNPIQSISVISDRCILVRYKISGLLRLFYVAVKARALPALFPIVNSRSPSPT